MALALLASLTAIAIGTALVLAVSGSGRLLTYVLLAAVVLLGGIAFLRVRKLRRGLSTALDSAPEYIAITPDGIRFAGTQLAWSQLSGGLIIDERNAPQLTRKPRIAAFMRAVGYSRVEVHLGAVDGTASQLRAAARPSARRMYSAFLGTGAVRIPLEWAVPSERVAPIIHGLRVSAAQAGMHVVYTADPTVIRETLMIILTGKRLGATEHKDDG